MSALTQEWAPGAVTPGARPFENEVDDLVLSGVQFAPEQLDLLEAGSLFRPESPYWRRLPALAVMAMYDPVIPHSSAMMLPCITVDAQLHQDPVLIPTVVEIDCTEFETFDEREPGWRRFPSLLGRAHIYDPFELSLLDGLTPFRLWNLWPIENSDVDMVLEARNLWLESEWKPFTKWLEVRDNADSTACDLDDGVPEAQHDHEYDEHGFLRSCVNGDAWFEHYMLTEITFEVDGDPYHRPFGPVGGLHHLGPVWEHLLASSQANTHASLLAYPEWEREQVARTERHYSPWLWSS